VKFVAPLTQNTRCQKIPSLCRSFINYDIKQQKLIIGKESAEISVVS